MRLRRPVYQWRMRRREAKGALLCPVCRSVVTAFQPHGNPPRPNVRCPVCQSKACHRLCWVYFDAHPGLFRRGGAFLHIAPEAELGRWLKKQCKSAAMNYRFGDIRERKHYIDIESTRLPDASVDVLFACHVLNMVRDDRRALREIARILKPCGTAVIPVPLYDPTMPMKEAGSESDISVRLELFADQDMHRAYTAAEFERRVQAVGLALHTFTPRDVQDSKAAAWALPEEPIQIVVRPPAAGDKS